MPARRAAAIFNRKSVFALFRVGITHRDLNDLEKEAADSAPKRNEIPPAGGSDLMKMAQSRQRIHISALSLRINEKCRSVPSKLPTPFCKHGANCN
jgi:hypothetical protein